MGGRSAHRRDGVRALSHSVHRSENTLAESLGTLQAAKPPMPLTFRDGRPDRLLGLSRHSAEPGHPLKRTLLQGPGDDPAAYPHRAQPDDAHPPKSKRPGAPNPYSPNTSLSPSLGSVGPAVPGRWRAPRRGERGRAPTEMRLAMAGSLNWS